MGADLSGYDPAWYGESVGNDYDLLYPGNERETAGAVAFIGELARSRPERAVVEFGVGTGRLALPLHEQGLLVAGIDGSETMVKQLRRKTHGAHVPVVIGDYRSDRVHGKFSVALLAINGIFDPRGLPAQLDIFRNAARHLGPHGYFVVETWVMNEAQRSGDWSVVPRYVGREHVELQLARYHLDTNTIERTLVHLRPTGPAFVTVVDTYAAPGELDVMAEVTGFERVGRYGAWSRAQFTATSSWAISVYRLRGE